MSDRLIFQALSDLARQVEDLNHTRRDEDPAGETDLGDPAELDKQVRRLAREFYKANTLAETQSEQTRQALDMAQRALDGLQQERDRIARQAKLDLIEALLPVVDGIEAGLKSGAAQVKMLAVTAPEAAQALAAWLKGQQLLRERLLRLLAVEGVVPVAAVGHPFNPYHHVAVKAVSDPTKESGMIIAEERRGYRCGEQVLRYADVVVNRRSESG
jgi:molecular chaperone GrpE